MTYKDIVLKLLNSREALICLEDHLMSDFRDSGHSNLSFNDWCQMHNIECQRIFDEVPQKLRLKKSELVEIEA